MLTNIITSQAFHPQLHPPNLHHIHTVSVQCNSTRNLVFHSPSRLKVNSILTVSGLESEQEEEENNIPIGARINYSHTSPPWGNIQQVQKLNKVEYPNSANTSSKLKPKLHFLEETNEETLSKRLLELSRCNKVTSALELFMSMEVSGLQPSSHACNALISSLLRNEFLDDALNVFDIMRKNDNNNNNKSVTCHTCSLILKALATTRGFDSTLEMFMELENRWIVYNGIDAILYNTMITICGKVNNWVETERIWKLMKDGGVRGTNVTYSLLVSVFVRCGRSELAFDAYDEMMRNELKPREDTMKAMISMCTKEGKWDVAMNVFQSMLDSGFNPNIVVYNSLINSLGKSGELKLAFRVFNCMRSSGHTPDSYTWNALAGALNRAKRYEDALSLFESIEREKSSQLSPHLYNSVLVSCQRLGLCDRSLQIIWEMETSGLSVSTASYNLVLGACEVARKPKIALQVYEQMLHQNCTPNTFTYLLLVRACISGTLWSELTELLEHVPPNVPLYNEVIHGMCLQGKTTLAKKLYIKMHEIGLKPDGKTRALMIQNLKPDGKTHRDRR